MYVFSKLLQKKDSQYIFVVFIIKKNEKQRIKNKSINSIKIIQTLFFTHCDSILTALKLCASVA